MGSRARSPEESLSITMPDDTLIVIQPFPREPTFMRDIARAVQALPQPSPDMLATWEQERLVALQSALRSWYPRLEIHPRNALAGLTDHDRVWYVLRDGRVRPASDRTNRLHAALSNARRTSAESDDVVERSRAAISLASQPRSRRRREAGGGRRITELSPVHDLRPVANRLGDDVDADDAGHRVDAPGAGHAVGSMER